MTHSKHESDPKAAAIHRAKANKHYDDAERFRKLGLVQSERDARAAARHEDTTAELLERGTYTDTKETI